MRKYIVAALFMALICLTSAAHADVVVQNDRISAYLDSSGGIILTGYEDRVNETDAADLISIDQSRVVFAVETGVKDAFDIMTVNIVTHAETTLVRGVKIASGYGGSGVYYVPAADPTSVDYISFSGATGEIFSSEEQVVYLQESVYGLIIGLEADAGAMVYDPETRAIEAFLRQLGTTRVRFSEGDVVLTADGELYLDDPAARFEQSIATDVSSFAGIDG
ncbi:MAG: hypothetical protein ACOYI5_07475, partial [Christensenellales bacterium]